jgi:hypothetical protein
MELSTVVGAACVLVGLPQGIEGYQRLARRYLVQRGEASMPEKPRFLPILLIIGALLSVAFGGWMIGAKPLRPRIQTVEKTVYVDRFAPCPPTQQHTGSGTTKGNNSPVVTGNGNKFDNGGAPRPEQ